MTKNNFNNKKRGFTIIETMIAISLFIIIVMIGMNALLNAGVIYQKSQDFRSVLDSLTYTMEDMSRNLRTGYEYRCLTSSADFSSTNVAQSGSSCWGIAFEPSGGNPQSSPADQWVYYIDNNGVLWKSTQGPYISNGSPIGFTQQTPSSVVLNLNASGFSILGAEPPSSGDQQQPLVNIRLSGTITSKGTVTPFSIQTSVSQRLLDI